MGCLRNVNGEAEITVKVVPGASRDRIVGVLGDALKVQVSAPPERGRANKAVASLLAETLGVSTRSVWLVSGTTSPRKVFRIEGCGEDKARGLLGLAG